MPRSSSAFRRCGRLRSCWAEIEPPTCMGGGGRCGRRSVALVGRRSDGRVNRLPPSGWLCHGCLRRRIGGGLARFWGLEGPEYLAWLGEQPDVTYVMGANTERLPSRLASGETTEGTDEFTADEKGFVDRLTRASKVVFSATFERPLASASSTLVRDDAAEAVRAVKEDGAGLLSTIGSLSLCRSLLWAGLVDQYRVATFPVPVITGAERLYDGCPDIAPRDERPLHLRRLHPAGRVPTSVLEPPPLETTDVARTPAGIGTGSCGDPTSRTWPTRRAGTAPVMLRRLLEARVCVGSEGAVHRAIDRQVDRTRSWLSR